MNLIYRPNIDIKNIEDYYFRVKNTISSNDERVELLIKMKRINNVYKSIKYRINDLKREHIIPEDAFFEENRTFALNKLNEYTHFIFTNKGIEDLENIKDNQLYVLVERYDTLLSLITSCYGKFEDVVTTKC